ncbi:hypothetical protein [Halogranum rubrum]|uniref:Uncharacterized protein n=1 Tax=Halogranum salarium B-1 TaxID=1210908 RepID=J3JHB4_9EURY|nr:hypothetical protein [Halogranum salarium]EJN60844.1 hypothetical protein HSB1_14470 [Halogranum salarium B-1]
MEFRITSPGIAVGDTPTGLQGVLTGTPTEVEADDPRTASVEGPSRGVRDGD